MEEEMISKKLVAQDMYGDLKFQNVMGYVAIAGFLVVAVVSVFSKSGGAMTAGIISAGFGYRLFQIKQKMEYLQAKYEVK